MGATAVYELDTEKEKDAQAIFERSQKIQEVGELFLCEELVLTAGVPVLYSSLISSLEIRGAKSAKNLLLRMAGLGRETWCQSGES